MRLMAHSLYGLGSALWLGALLSCGGGGSSAPPAGSAAVITLQPQDAVATLGQSAAFTAAAAGDPAPALQWRRGGTALPGETAATCRVATTTRADDGSLWTLQATNSLGTATSREARLTVQWGPAILTQPASCSLAVGQSATFTVVGEANPAPTYQWRRDGQALPGAVQATYRLSGLTLADHGARFTCVLSNRVGSVTSEAATLSVTYVPGAPVFTSEPSGQAVKVGQTATFTASATGDPAPTFQWRRNGVDLPGATSSACTTPPATKADDGARYQVTLRNAAGTLTSGEALLQVQWLAITSQPAAQTVPAGATVTFSVGVDANPAPACQWRKDGVVMPGATGTTLTLPGVSAADAGSYGATLTNAAGSLASAEALLGIQGLPVSIKIIGINDYHGNIDAPAGSVADPLHAGSYLPAGDAEYLGTWVATLKARNPNHVVVSGGDNIGGSPLVSALFHDEPTIACLDLLGLEFSAVGNHDLDEGRDELLRIQNGGCSPTDGCAFGSPYPGARFRYLASNIVDRSTGTTLFPPYAIKTFQGVPVAFVGSTTVTAPTIVRPSGITTLAFGDEAAAINALVPELKAKGVEVIVVLLHEGGSSIRTLLDPAVAVIVAGHDHIRNISSANGNLLVEAGSNGLYVSEIDLTLDPVTHKLAGIPSAVLHGVTDDVARDALQTAVVAKADALAAPLENRVVGSATAILDRTNTGAGESVMGDLMADAHLEAGGDARIAFTNSGGLRADLVPAPDGSLTYGQVFTAQPFGNVLITMNLRGSEIASLLESQWQAAGGRILQVSRTLAYAYDSTQPLGSRLVPGTLKIDGVLVDPAADYRVTVNDYLAAGGDQFALFTQGRDRVAGPLDADAVEAYFLAHSPVSPTPRNRIARVR